jgi:hypothetical protein
MIFDEEYEFSECSEKAIRFFYPDDLKPSHPLFDKRMKELQMQLIECKLPFMFVADKRRAVKTLKFLRGELKKV